MSKSRLEKFLYALYSLDSSDLPNPLSRIEELYECLVTGDEAPTFEPLSRVEKYLMAILGVYDVNELPNPISRVEVLLHKLAIGDDNLDDIKSFISEHEELLAEIIRNGGVGGNIDIEYMLYTLSTEFNTLYNTAGKPVKSAILKGQTLVNLSENFKTITRSVNDWFIEEKLMDNIEKIKRNTYYTVLYRLEHLSGNHENYNGVGLGIGLSRFNKDILGINITLDKNGGWCKIGFQLTDDFIEQNPTYKQLYIRPIKRSTVPVEGESIDYTIRGFAILEGDYITNHIPFNEVFEGMQSVKVPGLKTVGKNLFHGEIERGSYSAFSIEKVDSDTTRCRSSIIHLIPDGFNGTISISDGFQFYLRLFKGAAVVRESGFTGRYSLDNTSNTFSEVTIVIRKVNNTQITDDELTTIKIQIEEGSAVTEYEPHKSNILTVNEDVVLRGIGEVKDELNCLTSEYVQRIGEIVLDGSEDWRTLEQGRYNIKNTLNNVNRPNWSNINFKCDELKPISFSEEFGGTLGICLYAETNYDFIVRTDIQTVEEFKQWLSDNPTTVHYQLATESVKTVDLSVVNQDGNDAKLSTFDDITHVTLSSEGLIPEAELEVATKNEEVLNTMSLEMDDISKTQNDLQETSDTQSENVDATMLATTEIYEGLL